MGLRRISRSSWLGLCGLLVLGGCDTGERIDTSSVLSHDRCRTLDAGLTEVTLAQVASIRGTELLSASQLDGDDANAPPLLIAISRGPQPSRGFELHLADQARATDDTLLIEVFWTEPDPIEPQPLTTTHPCLVVSVPAAPWRLIEARDQHGTSLGTLVREVPTPADSGQ